jgi:hypothetical protein
MKLSPSLVLFIFISLKSLVLAIVFPLNLIPPPIPTTCDDCA